MTLLRDINRGSGGARDSGSPWLAQPASAIPTGGDFPSLLLNDIDSDKPNQLYRLEVPTPPPGDFYVNNLGVGRYSNTTPGTYSGTQRVKKYDPNLGLVSSADGPIAFAISSSTPSVTGVSVTPATATGAADFDATVLGEPGVDQAVTWSLIPPAGTVSASGAFVPPDPTDAEQVIKVRATSVQNNTKYGEATVTIAPLQQADFVASQARTLAATLDSARPFAAASGGFWNTSDAKKPYGPKDPNSVIDFSIDWSTILADMGNATITQDDVLAPAGLVMLAKKVVSGKQSAVFSGGVANGNNSKIAVTYRITVSGTPPRTIDRTFYLQIEET